MQRPNRPMSGLEKFGLDTVSPSTINDWISYRPKFVIRKYMGTETYLQAVPSREVISQSMQ